MRITLNKQRAGEGKERGGQQSTGKNILGGALTLGGCRSMWPPLAGRSSFMEKLRAWGGGEPRPQAVLCHRPHLGVQ